MNAIARSKKAKVFDITYNVIKTKMDEGNPLSVEEIGALFLAATERVVFGE